MGRAADNVKINVAEFERIRRELLLTPIMLAERVGVTTQTICNIRKGRMVTLKTALKIAKALRVSAHSLIESFELRTAAATREETATKVATKAG